MSSVDQMVIKRKVTNGPLLSDKYRRREHQHQSYFIGYQRGWDWNELERLSILPQTTWQSRERQRQRQRKKERERERKREENDNFDRSGIISVGKTLTLALA